MKRRQAIAVLSGGAAFAMRLPIAPQAERRDGNWWTNLPPVVKEFYATGTFDGVNLGQNLLISGLDKQDIATISPKAIVAYNKSFNRFLNQISAKQVSDGLDTFYSDFRNRRIRLSNAVWIVLNQISGKPETETEKMIENYRKSAGEEK